MLVPLPTDFARFSFVSLCTLTFHPSIHPQLPVMNGLIKKIPLHTQVRPSLHNKGVTT